MEPPISSRNGPSRAVLLGIFAGILCLTFAAYLPAVSAGYVWDDDAWLTANPLVSDTEGLVKIWTTTQSFQYYPLLFTTFWVEHQVWGLDPTGYHVVNIFLHACNAFLVGLILNRLGVPAAWWVAVIFAVHPVHVESVAWVTERKNVLSGVFGLSAALVYLAFDRDRRRIRYALALLLFACAMLAKTASATLPVALAMVMLWRRRPATIRDLLPLAPFVLIAAALASVTVFLEEGLVAVVRSDFHLSAAQRIVIAARALLFYPSKLLFPYPLIFNYPRSTLDAGSWNAIRPVVAVALIAMGLAALWIRGSRGSRGVACAACVYAITILPALGFFNVYAFRYSFVADHFQYLASIGPLTLLALAGRAIFRAVTTRSRTPIAHSGGSGWRRMSSRVAAGAIVVVLAAMTWNQAGAYRDESTLWKDTLAKNKDSWIAHHSLATLDSKSGNFDSAVRQFDEALRCKPTSAESFTGRGHARAKQGQLEPALADLNRAIELDPTYPQAYLNRGEVRVAARQFEGAIADIDRFLSSNPRHAPAYQVRAAAFTGLGQLDRAIADLDEAVRLDGGAWAYRDRAMARLQLGQDATALEDFTRALDLEPGAADLYDRRGFVLVRMGRYDKALADFEQALRIDPRLALSFVLRGGLFQRLDADTRRACEDWREACRLGDCKTFNAQCKP